MLGYRFTTKYNLRALDLQWIQLHHHGRIKTLQEHHTKGQISASKREFEGFEGAKLNYHIHIAKVPCNQIGGGHL